MTIIRIILAGAASLVMSQVWSQAASAEQGMVTKIDRLSHTISIQPTAPTQTGTIGASTGGAVGPVQEFKAQDGLSLDDVHVGDRVNYSATQNNGAAKTITKLDRQK